jgi:DNA-binding response OmpR family regulator
MHEDFQVTEASDGKVGIALAMKERPDIILLEMIIPEHNGMEILAQLRQNEWGRTAKVVLFTHLKDTHEMLRGITAYEPSLYLIKGSWEISDVVAKVKEVLGIEAK